MEYILGLLITNFEVLHSVK